MKEYGNSQVTEVVNEYVHNKKHREILLLKYIDGLTYEQIGEIHKLTDRQVKNIVYKYQDLFLRHLIP